MKYYDFFILYHYEKIYILMENIDIIREVCL